MNNIDEIINSLLKLEYNPIEIKAMMHHAVESSINEMIEKNYTLVEFDSPMGADAVRVLKQLGYTVDWKGNIGERGITTVYLSKNPNDVTLLKARLRNNLLIDVYSTITVK